MGSWFVVRSCFQQNPTDGMLLMACVVHFTIFYHLICAHGHTSISWIQGHTKVFSAWICMNILLEVLLLIFVLVLETAKFWSLDVYSQFEIPTSLFRSRMWSPTRFGVHGSNQQRVWRSPLRSQKGLRGSSLSSDRRARFWLLTMGHSRAGILPLFLAIHLRERRWLGWESFARFRRNPPNFMSSWRGEKRRWLSIRASVAFYPSKTRMGIGRCRFPRSWEEWFAMGSWISVRESWTPLWRSFQFVSQLSMEYIYGISPVISGWIIRTCHVTTSLECFSPGEGLRNLTRQDTSHPSLCLSHPCMVNKHSELENHHAINGY